MEITKAIIPAAGIGSRFLPFTKAMPKEMLPLLNKPACQYIIEEGIASSINQFIIITNKGKQAIANHFDYDFELETILKDHKKTDFIASLEKISRLAEFCYIRQPEPLGLGHAIWLARNVICNEYFGIFLPDDILISKNPGLAQLIQVARQEKASVIAVQEVPLEQTSSYGIIDIKKQITPNLYQVSQLVEKPDPKNTPSNLGIIGRYILSPKIFQAFEEIEADNTGELQLTDAIDVMIRNNEKVFAYKVQGTRYDIGNPIGWVKAVIGCALQDPQYAKHIKDFLEDKKQLDTFYYNQTKLIEHNL